MKKKYAIVIVFVLGIIVSILMLSVFMGMHKNKINPKVFSNISDFDKLNELVVEGLNVSDDNCLGSLRYKEFYAKKIRHNGNEYDVWAYVFDSAEEANEYFNCVTGKDGYDLQNFSLSGNYYFHNRYIAYYDGFLYRVEGGAYSNFIEFLNWLNEDFVYQINTVGRN